MSSVAQKIVKDWCDGQIKYFSMPPVDVGSAHDLSNLHPIDTELVNIVCQEDFQEDFFQVNALEALPNVEMETVSWMQSIK